MRATFESIRALVREYSAEFDLSREDLLHELIVGVGILIAVWGLQALVLVEFGK